MVVKHLDYNTLAARTGPINKAILALKAKANILLSLINYHS